MEEKRFQKRQEPKGRAYGSAGSRGGRPGAGASDNRERPWKKENGRPNKYAADRRGRAEQPWKHDDRRERTEQNGDGKPAFAPRFRKERDGQGGGRNRAAFKPRFDREDGEQGGGRNRAAFKPRFDREGGEQGGGRNRAAFKPRYDREGGEQGGGRNRAAFKPRYDREGGATHRLRQPRAAEGLEMAQARAQEAAPAHKKVCETIRLNRYIANAGICSRREADKLIAAGSVMVNGKVVTEMGFQVHEGDKVNYGGETLSCERKRYFLLNKPKGYITTLDDPQCRETVMMLIDSACPERIYPVGRLDRNTTGLLLFTNDGDLAKRLTHPSSGVYKIYHVEVDRPVSHEDMRQMLEGIELEDGPIRVDDVQYAEGANDKRIVGVALHSGKNRIVRRIFEHFGYNIHKLDRVVFAGLTKKDVPRGRYRELTEKEVGFLKMI